MQLACELRKPLFLHCRDAGDAFAAVLRCAPRRCCWLNPPLLTFSIAADGIRCTPQLSCTASQAHRPSCSSAWTWAFV